MTFQNLYLIPLKFHISLIVQLFGCFIADGQIIALITYTRQPYEIYTKITQHLSLVY